MNMLHVTAKPRVVYRAVYFDWKLRKTGEKHAGRSLLLYKLDLKAANVEQTHTHTQTHKVSTVTLVRICAERYNDKIIACMHIYSYTVHIVILIYTG